MWVCLAHADFEVGAAQAQVAHTDFEVVHYPLNAPFLASVAGQQMRTVTREVCIYMQLCHQLPIP